MSDHPMVCVRWHCGYYVGQPYWQRAGDWVYEPATCDTEFDTEEDQEEWNERMCSAECPTCGATLSQKYDKPERIDAKVT